MAIIYHGTPLTPRVALMEVCRGRAMCVSFFRPDDLEAVEAISPDIMFRQRGFFNVEGSAAQRRRLGGEVGLVGLFRLVGAAPFSPRQMGCCAGYAGSSKPTQRCAITGLAFRAKRRSALAHGCANRTANASMRAVRPSLPWVDRRREAPRSARISSTNARGGSGLGQPLAGSSHDARHQSGVRLPLCQRGRHHPCSKRVAL